MLINCFKEFSYDINLTPIQVISKIKSKTVFARRLNKGDEEFEGSFTNNSFKIHFILPGNIWVHQGYNPIFYGKTEKIMEYTKLRIKMRPDILGYFVLIFSLLFFFAALVCFILFGQKVLTFLIISLIMSFGFIFVFFFGIANIKYKNMKITLEEIFQNDLLSICK